VLFNSFEFAVFFVIVVMLHVVLPFRYRWLHLLIIRIPILGIRHNALFYHPF